MELKIYTCNTLNYFSDKYESMVLVLKNTPIMKHFHMHF